MAPSDTQVYAQVKSNFNDSMMQYTTAVVPTTQAKLGVFRGAIAKEVVALLGKPNRRIYDAITIDVEDKSTHRQSYLRLSFKGVTAVQVKDMDNARSCLQLCLALYLATDKTISIKPVDYSQFSRHRAYSIVKITPRLFQAVSKITGRALAEGARSEAERAIAIDLDNRKAAWKLHTAARLAHFAWVNKIKTVKALIAAYTATNDDLILERV